MTTCTHNRMVANDEPGFAWKCADCGYVYGKGERAMKQYTLVGLWLDHPSAVAETFVLHYQAERWEDHPRIEGMGERTWSHVVVFEGDLTPEYVEKFI